MGRVITIIEIEASPEKIFDFMGDTEKLNEISKGVAENKITNLKPDGVGTTLHTIIYISLAENKPNLTWK